MKNILIYPSGTEIGLELYRSLSNKKGINIVGANSIEDHSELLYERCVCDLPFVNSNKLRNRIQDLIAQHDIDILIPAHDDAVVKFSKWQDQNYFPNCMVLTSPYETCNICRSKRKTAEKLSAYIKTAKIFGSIEKIDTYPIFAKPDFGQGSQGAELIANKNQAENYAAKYDNPLFLEYLPGEEYTVDCFTDKNGSLQFVSSRKRERISNGISVRAVECDHPDIGKIASVINDVLALRGVWFFQLKEDNNGELVLLEIAPRVAGTMGYQRAKGVNLPLLAVYDFLNINIKILKCNYHIIMDRALYSKYKIDIEFKTVYIDYDDTLVANNQVNPKMIGLVYKFVNEGKQIILLTRHSRTFKEEVRTSMEKYNIPLSLFSAIKDVGDTKKKSEFIKSTESIFIDDSFRERMDIQTQYNIPVFDVNEAIEIFL